LFQEPASSEPELFQEPGSSREPALFQEPEWSQEPGLSQELESSPELELSQELASSQEPQSSPEQLWLVQPFLDLRKHTKLQHCKATKIGLQHKRRKHHPWPSDCWGC